ncbi:MAG: hypothetical protein ACD_68C00021G0002 [uncultured bacterium]|nr:MAG: hypothetical protein ACD_68C00021G0002 [uncultured bacterium]
MNKSLIKLAAFSLSIFCLSTFTNIALAGSDSGEEFGGVIALMFGAFWIFFMIFIFAASIVSFVLWIMMLIHAASNDIENKTVWILVLALTGIVGAIAYYFIVKRNFVEPTKTDTSTTASPPAPPPTATK